MMAHDTVEQLASYRRTVDNLDSAVGLTPCEVRQVLSRAMNLFDFNYKYADATLAGEVEII